MKKVISNKNYSSVVMTGVIKAVVKQLAFIFVIQPVLDFTELILGFMYRAVYDNGYKTVKFAM